MESKKKKKACVIVSGSDLYQVMTFRGNPMRDGRLALSGDGGRLRIEVGECRPKDRQLVATIFKRGKDGEVRVVYLENSSIGALWYEQLIKCKSARIRIRREQILTPAQAHA